MSQYSFSRAAIAKQHKLGGLEMHHLTVLEARSPKSRCHKAMLPLTTLGKICSCLSPNFWLFLGLWKPKSNLHKALALCACVCMQLFPFYKDTSHNGFRVCLTPV